MPRQAPLPNFLLIGVQRGAIRWLRANLDQHPDVFMPSAEVSFFSNRDRYRKPGVKWYRNQFDAWDGEEAVGEFSTSYLTLSTDPVAVAERIKNTLPDVRLIAVVRQPVDRMYSAMLHHIKRGRLAPDTDLYELVRDGAPEVAELDLIGAGLYGSNLFPFWRNFGDRLLVVVLDDLRDQPDKIYEQVLRHLDVPTDFEPRDLHNVLFSNRNSVAAKPLSDDQHRELYQIFRTEVEELEALLGRDLSAWDPGPPRRVA